MRVYFDNAATTPLDKEVLEAMLPVLQNEYGNPSSIHGHGRTVRALIEEARKKVATLLNVTPSEIFFTSGGTEADNMALRCSVEHLGVKSIITSPIEHHAVLHTAEDLAQSGKAKLYFVDMQPNGHINYEHLEQLMQENPKSLVSLMYGNNEIGNVLNVDRVAELCKQYNCYFHCDTVQAIGHYPIDLQKTNIHFIAGAAHKFNGPKGIGFIYINNSLTIKPFITGGSQERNMRGGTENVYGIVGLAKALEIACRDREKKKAHISGIKNYMITRLKEEIADISFNGDCVNENSLYTVLSVSFPPSKVSGMMLFRIDMEGISCSGGSACSSGSDIGSHVMRALNTDPSRANVRFSFGKQNTKEEVDYTVAKIKEMMGLAK